MSCRIVKSRGFEVSITRKSTVTKKEKIKCVLYGYEPCVKIRGTGHSQLNTTVISKIY